MRTPRPLVLAVSALLLAGCGAADGGSSGDVEEVEVDTEPLFFEPIGRGLQAARADTTEAVARDSAAWARLSAGFTPPRPFAPVDFDQTMVLLAAVPVPTGGYSIEFESVEESDTAVVASYVVLAPADDCVSPQGAAVPFEAVYVRRSDLPVHFTHRRQRLRCSL